MKIYDLEFTDGKRCRYIAAQPEDSEQEELQGLRDMFCGRLVSMTRIIAPAPTKLPWKRDGSVWRIAGFTLSKRGDKFHCEWPGGEIVGGKDEVSAAVRESWQNVVLT